MHYNGISDEIVTSVEKYSDKEYIGLLLKTNYDTYKFGIDKFQICCENFDVTLYDESNKYLISANEKDTKNDVAFLGFFLKEINYCHARSCKNVEDNNVLSLQITLKNKELTESIYYIDISNYHNGYYPHYSFLEWKNYKDCTEL